MKETRPAPREKEQINMKKTRFTALFLGGMMLCLTAIPALAAENEPMVISPAPTSQTDAIAMPEHTGPDSLLYYGTVRVTARDAQGRPPSCPSQTIRAAGLSPPTRAPPGWTAASTPPATPPT